MNIEYENYLLEPEFRQFNLYKTIQRKKKDGTLYDDTVVIGYGMRFETCIEAICKDKMADRDELIGIRQYLDEYKKLKDEILLDIEP